ncbi:MAG: acyltransferase domain-containing protein, partial [Myxococcales bacterium]|nr:acyltransferase domain-containing protein [Myxococcales bacterium]
MFSGQGSQWPAMGRELWTVDADFREGLEEVSQALAPALGWSIADAVAAGTLTEHPDTVDVVQPLIFAMQLALARVWQGRGLRMDAVLGHSMGEIAAAVVADAIALGDAARLVCLRARLLATISGRGGMLSVALP